MARFAVLSVGAAVFLDQVKPLLSDAQFTWGERRVMGIVALSVFVSFGLAAWAAGMLLRAASELIEVFVDVADSATRTEHLVETQLGPNLARAASALERLASNGAPAATGTPSREAAEVRQAIASGRWGKAGRLVREMRARSPNAPEVAALSAELAEARKAEVADLTGRLEAARASGVVEAVADCRDALSQHLDADALHELDARVVRWLDRRLRSMEKADPNDPALSGLVERVADSFADTPEGRDLLARLPEIRRRAGLCPSCGRPYRGKLDACPECLREGGRPSQGPRGANP